MYAILLLAVIGAPDGCPCGPGCSCGEGGACACLAPAPRPAPLPTLDEGIALAERRRCGVVVWVGRRSPAGERTLRGVVHCYSPALAGRTGPGVCAARYESGGLVEWTWWRGDRAPLRPVAWAAGVTVGDLPPAGPGPRAPVWAVPRPVLSGPAWAGGGGCRGGR